MKFNTYEDSLEKYQDIINKIIALLAEKSASESKEILKYAEKRINEISFPRAQ